MNRSLKIAYLANLVFALGMGIHQQFLSLHLRNLGADAVAWGQFSAFGLLISALSYFPATWLCNRYDRKWLIVTGWIICIPVPLIYAFAPTWQWTLIGSFLFNISLFSNVALQNYVIRFSDPKKIAATLSQVFAAFSLGSVFSQPLGGWLVDRIGYTWIFVFGAVFYAISTLLYCFIASDHPSPEERVAPSLNLRLPRQHRRMLLAFCGIYCICVLPLDFVVPYIKDVAGLSMFWIGIANATTSLGGAFLTPLLGRVADKIGIFRSITINLGLTTLSMVLLVAFPGLLPMVLLSSLLRGAIRSNSLYTASLGGMARPEERSNLLSLYGFLSAMLATVDPMISGALYERAPAWPFMLTAALTIFTACLIGGNISRLQRFAAPRGEEQRAAEETGVEPELIIETIIVDDLEEPLHAQG